MGIFSGMDVNATGMSAQRLRLDVISQNIANVNTTRDEAGNPYRRKVVTFEEKNAISFDNILNNTMGGFEPNGVKVTNIVDDPSDLKSVYDPTHPDADENGYVQYPNVDVVTEMTDMIDASRAYEANVTAFDAGKAIALKGLDLGN